MLGVAVGQDDDVGAAEDRRDLGVLDEAGEEADPARRLGGEPPQRLDLHARVADDPELGPLDPPEGAQQRVDPLVWTEQAEEEDHRALGALELGRQRRLLGQPGQVVEGAVRDHPDPGRDRGRPRSRSRAAPCSEWAMTASMRPKARRALASCRRRGARRQDVVGGHHPRARRGQQQRVEAGDGQPLVVDDVGRRPAARRRRSMSGRCSASLKARRPGASSPRSALRR